MVKFGALSIQKKLSFSLGICLMVTIGLSSAVAVWLIDNKLRERVESQELPANVTAIRNDVLRSITGPLAQSQALAQNPFILKWEAAGLPDQQMADWQQYAGQLKKTAQASSIFWVSESTGKYLTDKGLDRTLSRSAPSDQWFYGFVSSGKKLSLDFDVDKSTNVPNLFINVRFEGEGGKTGVAGLGLEVASLAESISRYRIAETGHVYLVRPDGTVLLHGDKQLTASRIKVSSLPGWSEQAVAPLLEGKPYVGTQYSGPNGKQLAASSYIPELNVYVFAEVPEAEVIGPVRNTLIWVTSVTGWGAVLISALLVMFISRAVTGSVKRASSLLGEIADGDGDLTRQLTVETQDEVGELASNFNRFVGSLSNMVGLIRQSTDMINTASTEVAIGNQDLSSRTEQAASALQETAAAMSQITDSVKRSAETASHARSLTESAMGAAKVSGTAMEEVVSTMAEISSSSVKIRDIIGVIDGIAFQTNILALNAAVEAARAGEQGRGFAVVASEVRALAQRSAGAAKEIRTLISNSVQMVENGSEHVQKAGDSINGLIEEVVRVNGLISELSVATHEQGSGIVQINQAITQLDSMTQQNAALVEESTAAAESLRQQTAKLADAVSAFKVRNV